MITTRGNYRWKKSNGCGKCAWIISRLSVLHVGPMVTGCGFHSTARTDFSGLLFGIAGLMRQFPIPFNPAAPPVCCLSLQGPVDIERAEITETSDTIEAALQGMLEELVWNCQL